MLKSGYSYRVKLKQLPPPPLSNLDYDSATPLNFAEFGAPVMHYAPHAYCHFFEQSKLKKKEEKTMERGDCDINRSGGHRGSSFHRN